MKKSDIRNFKQFDRVLIEDTLAERYRLRSKLIFSKPKSPMKTLRRYFSILLTYFCAKKWSHVPLFSNYTLSRKKTRINQRLRTFNFNSIRSYYELLRAVRNKVSSKFKVLKNGKLCTSQIRKCSGLAMKKMSRHQRTKRNADNNLCKYRG